MSLPGTVYLAGGLFDALVRHIDAATPAQLRDIACAVLRWEGHDARITDGPFDGGADLRLDGADGAALPVVVAVSVEREYLRGRSEDVDLTDLRRAWERARAG